MAISVECECGRDLRIKEELAGKRVRCPDCKSIVSVPEALIELEEEQPEESASASERAPIRKVKPREPAEEYAVARRKSVDEQEFAPRARRKARRVREKETSSSRSGISVNAGIISGLLMMIGAVVWFVAGLFLMDVIFFYPPILFCVGIGAMYKGLRGQN